MFFKENSPNESFITIYAAFCFFVPIDSDDTKQLFFTILAQLNIGGPWENMRLQHAEVLVLATLQNLT